MLKRSGGVAGGGGVSGVGGRKSDDSNRGAIQSGKKPESPHDGRRSDDSNRVQVNLGTKSESSGGLGAAT